MSAFSDYVTSTAFGIQLSASQCRALVALYLIEQGDIAVHEFAMRMDGIDGRSLDALRRRGLMDGYGLTVPGELVAQLVMAAGVTK